MVLLFVTLICTISPFPIEDKEEKEKKMRKTLKEKKGDVRNFNILTILLQVWLCLVFFSLS